MRDSRWKILIWPLGIALAIGLYFSENIRGHYRFKQMCAKDGGLRVYAPLERDQIHIDDEDTDGKYIAHFRGVKAGRAKDPVSGQLFDYKLTTGHPTGGLSRYEKTLADLAQVARYKWVRISISLKDELRLGRSGFDIYDLQTGKLAVTYYHYGYRLFDPNTVFLGGGPGGASCPAQNGQEYDEKFETAFTKQ